MFLTPCVDDDFGQIRDFFGLIRVPEDIDIRCSAEFQRRGGDTGPSVTSTFLCASQGSTDKFH
jgi:hypothetical protein